MRALATPESKRWGAGEGWNNTSNLQATKLNTGSRKACYEKKGSYHSEESFDRHQTSARYRLTTHISRRKHRSPQTQRNPTMCRTSSPSSQGPREKRLWCLTLFPFSLFLYTLQYSLSSMFILFYLKYTQVLNPSSINWSNIFILFSLLNNLHLFLYFDSFIFSTVAVGNVLTLS